MLGWSHCHVTMIPVPVCVFKSLINVVRPMSHNLNDTLCRGYRMLPQNLQLSIVAAMLACLVMVVQNSRTW